MQQLLSVFKLLSDDTRLRLLMLLLKEDLCVCEISGILGVSQPKVSKSLSKLRDLNLVHDERREKFVYYTLKRDDSFLLKTLQLIEKEFNRYPQLVKDQEGIKLKSQYSNQCCNFPIE